MGLTDAGLTEKQDYGPPNDVPPVIISTPQPIFTEGTANTYGMAQHVVDDGVSILTYSLTNTLPNGLTLNASTGVLTYDGIGSASISQHQLIATDAVGFDTSNVFNINIAATGTAVEFPHLAISAGSGWGSAFMDTLPGGFTGRMQRIARHDLAMIGPWRTWEYSGSTGPDKDRSDICAFIKSFNPNIIIYQYTIPTDASPGRLLSIEPFITWGENGPAGGKADQEKWWLYDDGLGPRIFPTDVKFASGFFPDAQINLSDGTVADSAGLHGGEWMARAHYADSTDSGGDWITNGFGVKEAHDFDGVWQDILRHEPRTVGDWDNDGTQDARASVKGLAGKFNGDSKYHAEFDLLEPTLLHGGNMTQNAGPNGTAEYNVTIASGYKDFVNSPFLEAIVGRTSSVESFAGWEAMMRYYKRGMSLAENMDPQHIFFEMWNVPVVYEATHSTSDFVRYGLCSCLMDNGYFGCIGGDVAIDAVIINEYDFNLGQAIDAPKYDGAEITTSNSGSGYVAFENGVHLREFDNGAVT